MTVRGQEKMKQKMDKKLRLIKRDKLDYEVPIPERFKELKGSKIRIRFIDGEYKYIPTRYTLMKDVRFSYDELQLIVDELKRLNG